jgi:hypothetical protein
MMVVFRQAVKCLLGLFDGAGHITVSQRKIGAGGRDCPRQDSKFRFVRDDQAGFCF